MVYRIAFVSLFVLLASCAQKHELAKCSGPAVALNADRWTPTAEQQEQMNRLVKDACK